MTLGFILVIILISLLIGLSKGGLGGPAPVAMITPLMSLVMPAGQAVGLVLPLLLFGDVFAVWLYWQKWDNRYLRLLLPMGVVGVALGSLALAILSHQDTLMRRVLGLFTLAFVVYKVASVRLQRLSYHPQDWHGYLAGWASGFGSALANLGAPPFTAYMLLQDLTPTIFIGTTTLYFAILNALKLPGVLLTGNLNIHQFFSILWVIPVIPLGVWLGRQSLQHMNPKVFESLMLVLLFALSLFLLFVAP
jgi:uncharacterized membrane protein YfcA